jgi:hypothetical protein
MEPLVGCDITGMTRKYGVNNTMIGGQLKEITRPSFRLDGLRMVESG